MDGDHVLTVSSVELNRYSMCLSKRASGMSERLHSLDGFRAIVHVSIIALHAAMLTTCHMSAPGNTWDAYRKNPVYTFMMAGGTQVDLMFMLSGFLLVDGLLRDVLASKSPPSIVWFAIKRALRLLVPMLVITLPCLYFGDLGEGPVDPTALEPMWMRVLATLTFITNFFHVKWMGSFSLSLCWSNCVDLHVSIALVVLVGLCRYFTTKKDASTSAKRLAATLRVIFFLLFILSLVIRAVLFDENKLNLFKMGQYSHFGQMMTDSSRALIQNVYNFTVNADNTAANAFTLDYVTYMYYPTHTRFGPFAVGGVLACNVFMSRLTTSAPSTMSTFLAWMSTVMAAGFLLMPCLPSPDEAPVETQWFATVAIRGFSAIAAATILFRTLVPSVHPWHWSLMTEFLSLPLWKPISSASYFSYLIHFRMLMELSLRKSLRSQIHMLFGALPEADESQFTSTDWILFSLKMFAVVFVCSMTVSTILHHAVEKPADTAIRTWLQRTSAGNEKKTK